MRRMAMLCLVLGFAALACQEPCGALFLDVPWSTPEVASTIRQRATSAGLRLEDTTAWYDVDEVTDLQRLAEAIGSDGSCPHTRRFLEELTPTLTDRLSDLSEETHS